MIRRNARLRREYIYRKSLEGKERTQYERKRLMREALEEGKPIPTELRADEAALREEIALEDAATAGPSGRGGSAGAGPASGRAPRDDEYRRAGEADPKVLLTTSRDPSSRLIAFCKELKLILPNSQRINRGNQVTSALVDACRTADFTDIVVVHEHRGEPDGLIVCHLPFGPTAYFGLSNAVLRHDLKGEAALGNMSLENPRLVLDNFGSALGTRVATILKHLFPVPKPDAKRVVTFAHQADYISFRHHTYTMPRGPKSLELTEVGPRFEMRLYQIKLGTLDQPEAENEWVVRPHMNSAGKKAKLN